jgi:predicted SnoaL-like aldol condensation-catalyzing enzyme
MMLDTDVVENMYSAMMECNEKARKAKSIVTRNSYIQEASQIKKMITQIQHRTTQMEERKAGLTCELGEIVHYILESNLVTKEKLDELRTIAREKAVIKNEEDLKVIKQLYGEFESILTNRNKKDPTALNALKNWRE